jgi:hypothetical protein
MKNFDFKKLVPHLIAIGIFLLVAVIYCKPALESKVLQQSDVTNFKGAIQNSVEYAKIHDGKYPLWTKNVFSGMPTFQIGGINGNYVAGYVYTILSVGLPTPIQFFFLACICFYILCITLKINPYVGIMASLSFAYSTYNPVIISVGHDTKMLSIAFMPTVVAGVLLIYDKKYLVGSIVTVLFTSTMIAQNHLQIVYYLFLAIGIMTIYFLVKWIKESNWKHVAFASIITVAAVAVGVLSNAESLIGTYEFQKETIRGGASALTDTTNTKKEKATTGLDKDYAFSYSMQMTEPLVMAAAKIYGGSSDKAEIAQEKSKGIEALGALPKELQQQLPMQFYWGGMTYPGEVGTSGPPYAGAIICMLALLSFFFVDNKHRWWIVTTIIVTTMMSWGHFFLGFNDVLFKYLPFYNKFRAPSMILVIPTFLLALSAALMLNKIINTENKKTLLPSLYKGLIAVGVLFIFLLFLYFTADFMSGADAGVMKQVRGANQPQLLDYVNSFYDGLKEDRKSLMINSILRSFGFMAAAFGIIFLYIKSSFKPVFLAASIGILSMIDLFSINTKYLNSENYLENENKELVFTTTPKDLEIQNDKTDFRVFNVAGSFSENRTSYFYKSIGGYTAAKLRIYQDLIEKQLSKQQFNEPVLKMLNTKYIVQSNTNGVQEYQKLEGNLGPCWLVKNVVFVKDADAEMKALDNFNAKDTCFVQESYKASVPFLPIGDTAANIKLVKNDNDVIDYAFSSTTNQFAVFSEIYYKAGWKAFIDQKEAPIVKTNYVLRGLAIPAGNHSIQFRFEPQGYLMGKKIGNIALIVVLVMIVGYILSLFIKKAK